MYFMRKAKRKMRDEKKPLKHIFRCADKSYYFFLGLLLCVITAVNTA